MTRAQKSLSTLTTALQPHEKAWADLFFAQVDPDDRAALRPDQMVALVRAHLALSARRKGQVKMAFRDDGRTSRVWAERRTTLDIVTDDMAFLVDSIAATLSAHRYIVDMLLHPSLSVTLDAKDMVRPDPRGAHRQSHLHIVLRGALTAQQQKDLTAELTQVVHDVRDATGDWQAMRLRAIEAKQYLLTAPTRKFTRDELAEYGEFLDYLYDNNFTFLGCRTYRFKRTNSKVESQVVAGSGLGLLADDRTPAYISETGSPLPQPYQKLRLDMPPLYISKVNRMSTVHRRVPLDAVAVHHFDEDGQVVGETLFIGLFTSVTYSRSLRSIPLLKHKAERVIQASGFEPASHDGRALRHILEKYPRDELFQTDVEDLKKTCASILRLQERQRIALYCRRDLFGRYVSCLVYVPRDRFETRLRLKFQDILEQELDGTCTNYASTVDDSPLVRILFTIAVKQSRPKSFVAEQVEYRLQQAGRVWGDALADALHAHIHDDADADRLIHDYADAFSSDYRDRYTLPQAVRDIEKIEETMRAQQIQVDVTADQGTSLTLKIYKLGAPLVLSDILPILENMGLRVLTEHPFTVHPRGVDQDVVIHDIGVAAPQAVVLDDIKDYLESAFLDILAARAENDTLNALIIGAGLDVHQIGVVRTYVRYLRQTGIPFSLPYLEQAVVTYPNLARALVQLFDIQFNPKLKNRTTRTVDQTIQTGLDQIASLDHDRIWRALIACVRASLRTNDYQRLPDGTRKPYRSIKFDSRALDFLPNPKPYREIFVYSPRMEGIHLRNGRIARGGIRWSDRAEDFRTEILGLMKAQTVKNAVIVPSGAKGGFIVKHPPKISDRAALQAEGIECYRYLVRGLLDITDNLGKGNKTIPPKDVVARDEPDPYLVVAADKGTATFSDIANKLSLEYGFWLQDAFASGGSAGYDHKVMGITARGAWESVKRHFREQDHDTQTQPFDVMGVGDLAGDVFGNGMLLSPAIRLVGAFNHLHIFCDPTPDPKTSFTERQRLFKNVLGWDHYNTALLSKGGRIYKRSDKVLDLTPEIQKRFDLPKSKVSPPELMQAMLKARVDLMYLGGIGTFVKSSTETHADAGDRSNDALRINATDLRARVVGEGANLGFTQRARIEAALRGIALNADFVDNSAGVDTSDHEVNIKILCSTIMAADSARLTRPARDKLLREMTDVVAGLVLQDNYQQTQAISLLQSRASSLLSEHHDFMQALERDKVLDRALEFLPDDDEILRRHKEGLGLTRPELGILLSYAKLNIRQALLLSTVPDDAAALPYLQAYFPPVLQKKFARDIERHPLKREIIATALSNVMVNRLGPTRLRLLTTSLGVTMAAATRAFMAVSALLDLPALWRDLEQLDGRVTTITQLKAFYDLAVLTERLMIGALKQQGEKITVDHTLKLWAKPWADYADLLLHDKGQKSLLTVTQQESLGVRERGWLAAHLPKDLAVMLAARGKLGLSPWVLQLQADLKRPLPIVARTYLQLGDVFGFSWLKTQMDHLVVTDSWTRAALQTLDSRLDQTQMKLARLILQVGAKNPDPLQGFLKHCAADVAGIQAMVADLKRTGLRDLSMVLVYLDRLEQMMG